jgi:CBS domain-containing protein
VENQMANLIHNVLKTPLRKISYIHPDDSMEKCIQLMTELDIGALVVVDNDNQLVGIVSERDIVRSLHKGFTLNKTKAREIAFSEVTILSPHDKVEKAMQAITHTKRRHLLICEKNERIAILSIGDLLYYLLEDKSRTIEQLENYIHTY